MRWRGRSTPGSATSASGWTRAPGLKTTTDPVLPGWLLGGRQPSAGGQQPEHGLGRLLAGHRRGVDDEVGVLGLLVRVGDPGELADHARPGFGVEALPVAGLAHLERRGDVDQQEVADLRHHPPGPGPGLREWRDW